MREKDHLTTLSITKRAWHWWYIKYGYQDCWKDISKVKPSTQKDLKYNSRMNWSGIEAEPLWLIDRRLIAEPCRTGVRTEYNTHEVN
jgi:hypothetical protein